MDRPQQRFADALAVRHARHEFVETGSVAGLAPLPDAIAASWRRSKSMGVDPEIIDPLAQQAEEEDSAILRTVDDVLRRAAERFGREPVSLIFATTDGTVKRRYCGDSGLRRRLDSVYLEPGRGYGEQSVGTNGIGTALETKKPTLVHGTEHYNEQLSVFTCAGAPVTHPLSGATLGVVDLTCPATDSSGLLLATAATLAEQIEQALMDLVGHGEMHLLRQYLGACRHSSDPIIAQGGEIVMFNRYAQTLLTPEDRTELLTLSADFDLPAEGASVVADLPSGMSARLSYTPSTWGGRLVGGVVQVRLDDSQKLDSSSGVSPASRPLPGLVGRSPAWLRASGRTLEHATRRTSLVVAGERSVGKLSQIRAAYALVDPGGRFQVVECGNVHDDGVALEDLESALDEDSGALVLRNIDELDESLVSAVSELLVEHQFGAVGKGPDWIVATRSVGDGQELIDSAIIPCFDATVVIPPLRHRPEDIGPIAERMLTRHSRDGRVTFSSAALRHLSRLPLLGNLQQLESVVRECVQHKRSGVIDVADLPAQCQSATRRTLTQIEALERDAIVEALRANDGRKGPAAEQVGISRATIYRKIREYGIDARS